MSTANQNFDHIEKKEHPIYIDLKLMRNAMQNMNLNRSDGISYSMKELLDLAFQKNIIIQDSEEPTT